MWGLKERRPILDAYLEVKGLVGRASIDALRLVVENAGPSFIVDPQRFSLREVSFQRNWTFAVFCVAKLERQNGAEGLCEFALGRERGDMITQQPLSAFLSSGVSMALVDNQYELLRVIFDCSFNGEWANGQPTIIARNVPVAGKVSQDFNGCVRYISHLGNTFRLVW